MLKAIIPATGSISYLLIFKKMPARLFTRARTSGLHCVVLFCPMLFSWLYMLNLSIMLSLLIKIRNIK
jgi:hypothetical protein